MQTCTVCDAQTTIGHKYCHNCGAALASDEVLKEVSAATLAPLVRQLVSREFKDKSVVETEVSEAILNKLLSWAKLFAFFIGVPLALFLSWLAVVGISGASDLKSIVKNAVQAVNGEVEQTRQHASEQLHTLVKSNKEESDRLADALRSEYGTRVAEATKIVESVRNDSQLLQAKHEEIKRDLARLAPLKANIAELALRVERVEGRTVLSPEVEVRIRNLLVWMHNGDTTLKYNRVTVGGDQLGGIYFGIWGFNLASGDLHKLIAMYAESPSNRFSLALRPYLPRLESKDMALRDDKTFISLLRDTTADDAMRQIQEKFFLAKFILPGYERASEIGIKSALGISIVAESIVLGHFNLLSSQATQRANGTPASGVDQNLWVAAFLESSYQMLCSNPKGSYIRNGLRGVLSTNKLVEAQNWDLSPPLDLRPYMELC